MLRERLVNPAAQRVRRHPPHVGEHIGRAAREATHLPIRFLDPNAALPGLDLGDQVERLVIVRAGAVVGRKYVVALSEARLAVDKVRGWPEGVYKHAQRLVRLLNAGAFDDQDGAASVITRAASRAARSPHSFRSATDTRARGTGKTVNSF